MAAGFVYVMKSKSVKGVKIGFTERHPETRASELWTTGVPSPFEVRFAVWHPEADRLVRRLHEKWELCRINESREFFHIGVLDVIDSIVDLLLEGSGHCREFREFSDVMRGIAERIHSVAGEEYIPGLFSVGRAIMNCPPHLIKAMWAHELERMADVRIAAVRGEHI